MFFSPARGRAPWTLLLAAAVAATALVVAVVGAALAIGGHMGVGSLASYLVFVRQAAMPINQLTQLGNFMLTALAGAERVFSVMEEPAEKDEAAEAEAAAKAAQEGEGNE